MVDSNSVFVMVTHGNQVFVMDRAVPPLAYLPLRLEPRPLLGPAAPPEER